MGGFGGLIWIVLPQCLLLIFIDFANDSVLIEAADKKRKSREDLNLNID